MSEDSALLATELVLDVFRANGLLLAAGDEIAGRAGLTSARWQVLGAVALAEAPSSVPQIARRMGLTRQSVQISVNHLVGDGVLVSEPNAAHRRSPLFGLTPHGRAVYGRLAAEQHAWITEVAADLPIADLRVASRVLRTLGERLTGHETTAPTGAPP